MLFARRKQQIWEVLILTRLTVWSHPVGISTMSTFQTQHYQAQAIVSNRYPILGARFYTHGPITTLMLRHEIFNVTLCKMGLSSDQPKVASAAESTSPLMEIGFCCFNSVSELGLLLSVTPKLLFESERGFDGFLSDAKKSCTRVRHTRALERLGTS